MKLKEILRCDQIYREGLSTFDNEKTMNSVAIIFRKILNPCSKAQSYNYQLLLLQRSSSENSAYSGQVCFPGGRREAGQNSWQAVIRETKQQTGLTLNQQNLVVKIPTPFIVYQSRNRIHSVTGFIFELIPKNGQHEYIKINPSQISDFKWIPFDFFINLNEKVKNKLVYTKYNNFPFENTLPLDQPQVQLINTNLKAILYPSIKIGFKTDLFGFTYYVLISIMNKVFKYLNERKLIQQQVKIKVENAMNFSHDFRVELKKDCSNKILYEKTAAKTFQQSMSLYTGFWPKPCL